MDKDSFWKYQLSYAEYSFFMNYRYPANYYNELKNIAEYCKANKVNLVFIILPSHVDLQNEVADYILLEAEMRFRNDIMTLGKVYDFEYPNYVTNNRENFRDPFHPNKYVMRLVVDNVWGKSGNIVRFYALDGNCGKEQ